jgi:hypothetical protein
MNNCAQREVNEAQLKISTHREDTAVITRNTASVPAHQYLRTPTNSAHTA